MTLQKGNTMNKMLHWMPALVVAAALLLALDGVAVAKGGNGRKGHDDTRNSHRHSRWYSHHGRFVELKARSARHRKDLDEVRHHGVRVKARLLDHEQRIASLEARIDGVTADITSLADSINGFNDQLAALTADTEANAAAIANLKASIDGLQLQLTQAEQELNALYADLAAEVGDVKTALADHIAESQVINAEVQTQIADLQAQINELNDTLANSAVDPEDVAQLTVDLASLVADVMALTVSINSNTTDIVDLQTATGELTANQFNHVHVVRYFDSDCDLINCKKSTTRVVVSDTGQIPVPSP